MYASFSGLFGSANVDENEYTEEELAIEKAIQGESSGGSGYKWLALIDKLSGQDITKDEEVYKYNYIEALNRLNYWRQIDKLKHNGNN